jgi:hypothetical protein
MSSKALFCALALLLFFVLDDGQVQRTSILVGVQAAMLLHQQLNQAILEVAALPVAHPHSFRQQRSEWAILPRSHAFYDRIMHGAWSDTEFKEHLRMTRASFMWLCERLRPDLQGATRRAVSVEKKVSAALWKLARPVADFKEVSILFGISPGTVQIHFVKVIKAIIRVSLHADSASQLTRMLDINPPLPSPSLAEHER